jgi:hypothetical protein
MPSERLYLYRTPAVERALELASEVAGAAPTASTPQKLEAWLTYTTAQVEDELRHRARVEAYEELAQIAGRRDRVRRNTREAARRGLL